ncbi:MAG: glycosyltransferase family 4 protein [Bordetella sp.]|nr:glycosyltransferase family 4 protein [Bordetella sp.]
MTRKAVLDVGALFEEHWTGIPNVVAALVRHALEDQSIDWTFTHETVPLPRDLVVKFLRQRSGAGGLDVLSQLVWDTPPIAQADAAEMVAVFPNIKPVRRYFGKEAAIIHDLSPVVTPQFHNADNIFHFANRIRSDIETSEHLFCVSQATLTDVEAYFGKPRSEMSVIRLGCEFEPNELSAGALQLRPELSVERYVVVIGTLEPRKNGSLIFDYLMTDPGFASRFRIVFVGRDGWLDEKARLMNRLDGAGVAADRILFTGFISNEERTALMLNSAFCIYPSFFEGFGLPVLEAGALGKVTVCSNSSSMPEVLPEQCVFFDPTEPFEFAQALRTAELRAAQTRSAGQSIPDLLQRTAPHGWERCYAEIARWVKEQ